MKYILILTLMTFVACTSPSSNVVENENPSTENLSYQDTIPNWMITLYEKNDNLPEDINSQKVSIAKQLNDTVFYGILNQNTGICGSKILVTLLNQKEKDRAVLENFCDHDLAQGVYTWREFDIISSNKIMVQEFEEKVDDSLMDKDGWIKGEDSFDSLDKSLDSTQINLTIEQNGVLSTEMNLKIK